MHLLRNTPYYRWGKTDGPLFTSPEKCNTCVQSGYTVYFDGPNHLEQKESPFKVGWLPHWQEESALQADWQKNQISYLNQAITAAWKHIWDEFRCGKESCQAKEACGTKPVAIEVGCEPFYLPDMFGRRDPNMGWRLYILVVREIRCVAKDTIEDLTPEKYETLPPGDKIVVANDAKAQYPYFYSGVSKPPAASTKICDECTRIRATYIFDNILAKSEESARATWSSDQLGLLNAALTAVWKPMWNSFKCLNADKCGTKESCGDSPSYAELGSIAVPVVDPTAPLGVTMKWKLYATIEREIKCTSADIATEKYTEPKLYEKVPIDQRNLPPDGH